MKRDQFRSRLGFILLSAGCAIGIGNVWKFPYMAGQGGGGTFVLFYIIFLIILGLPILSMEMAYPRLYHADWLLSSDDVLHHGRRLDAALFLPDRHRPI